jgi:hypothetical protein
MLNMQPGSGCTILHRESKIAVSENGKTFILLNPSRKEVNVVKIDGCMVKNDVACDWMMKPVTGSSEIFIELKGSDVGHGFKQIVATIERFSQAPRIGRKACYIVSSRCPMRSTEVQKIALVLKKQYNATVLIRAVRIEAGVE